MRHAAWLAALLFSCGHAAAPPPSAPSALLEKPAPNIERRALDGSTVSTTALQGRPVLIEFFAEHCKPCLKSLPALAALADAVPELVIVGVSEDDDEATAARLKAELGLGFPVIHDRGHVLAGRYRVVDLPATFVLDPRGNVRWYGDRAHEAAELERVLEVTR
ncbi:MAG TPA: TlpA disulfide reductase family protein [Polyangiaceae bacterium]|nr:TlpA disulfide reductase family protein [Polyangiaceae bacterium]